MADDGRVREVDPDEIATVEQAAMLLVEQDPGGQLGEVGRGGPTQVPLDAEVAEEGGGRAGSRGRGCGPWCATVPEAMWEPISSGGTSCAVQRWIVWRSSGSMQSETQTRSVRSRMPRSTRPPPDEQRLDLDPGVGGLQLVEQPVDGQRLRVDAGRPSGWVPASTRSRLWSHFR